MSREGLLIVQVRFEMHRNYLFTVVCAACCLAAVGCERPSNLPELGQVTGVVTLNGEPVVGAEIQFCPDNARRSQGTTDEQGRFILHYPEDVTGAVVGNHTIRVMKSVGIALAEAIPPEFNRYSTLRREVKPGQNVIDIELISDTVVELPGDHSSAL